MTASNTLQAFAPADSLRTGQEALARGDHSAAATEFLDWANAAPADHEPKYWLASALMAGGQAQAAAQALEQARYLHAIDVLRAVGADLQRFQDDRAYRVELGHLLYARKLMGPASFALCQAIDFNRPDAALLVTYGLSLQHQGRMAEAVEVFAAAAGTFKHPEVHQFLICALFKAPDRLARASAEARRWAQLYAAPPAGARPVFANSRSVDRKLRVGYFAPNLTRSQTATSTLPVFEAHDPGAVDVFLYSADPAREAPQPAPCVLRGIGGLSDEAAAELIRGDRIDVLVDVWGHNAGSRLRMFALRPAPVQCGWINSAHATGLEAIDYVLHADSMDAPGADAVFTERIWRTGPVMAPYRPTSPALPPAPTPARANGFVTFGSFDDPAELSDETVAAWAAILRRRRADKLVLKSGYYEDPVLQRSTRARFAAHGAAPAQLAFRGHSEGDDHVRAFADIDLALAPPSCPGVMDAICYGTPVLALGGEDVYARACLPLLEPCGLAGLVADNWSDYVERALALTADAVALDALRARVRAGFDASPYRDEAGFTRRLEAVFREMFARWAASA